MSLVCAQCTRVNPADAAYCYHDGAALAGRSGGPLNPGSALFPTPFVFPNGQACRNFDQLAVTCQQHWTAALDLLKQGFLASFFGGLGRVDLAVAAQEAAKFPDPDRGLDQLLGKLPSQVIEAAKLQAEPTEINLGQLPIGTDRTIELHVRNAGMRLLYGSVASDARWLTLGDAPGQPQKVFQFGDEAVIPVQIRGQHLRAGVKPLEGKLVVDSNGGTVSVTVRADVPVTPFKGGLFGGAVTPRQVAEKSKTNPKEAAPYFEDGRVAAWFQSNGWTYPVQGPPMSGMGAVQQFFEALGVAKAPQVQIAPTSFRLTGEPGKQLHVQIEVSSPERKVVYGWAASDQPWVGIGKTKLAGRTATIPLTITVPDRAGTQEAKLTVTGNGQAKFSVSLAVAVTGGAEILDAEILEPDGMEAEILEDAPFAFTAAAPPVMTAAAPPVLRPASVPNMSLEPPRVMQAAPAPAAPVPAAPPAPPPLVSAHPGAGALAFAELTAPTTVAAAPLPAADLDVGVPGALVSRPALRPPARAGLRSRWLHLIPALLLLLTLTGTCMHDVYLAVIRPPAINTSDVDTRKLLELNFDYNFDAKRVNKDLDNNMMVGLIRYDPEQPRNVEPKKLTYGRHGHTNSLVLKIGGRDRVFGDMQSGRWVQKPENTKAKYGTGKICGFEFLPERIVVTQEVRTIPGEPVEVSPEVYKKLIDTCLFRYEIANHDKQPHEVGMRFLLDTYIGSNDDVPFTLPGQPGLVDTSKELKGADIPDFIQVLENPDLTNPGLIAQLNLRLGEKYEPPGRLLLTAHPSVQKKDGLTKNSWDIPLSSIKDGHDSSVVLYWEPAQMAGGQKREMAFTYGLGDVSIGKSARLGLTVGGAMLVGSELTVVALVGDPAPGQTVELELPRGLALVGGTPASQPVSESQELNKAGKPRPSPVSWRLRPSAEGVFTIAVTTHIDGAAVTQHRRITVKRAHVF